MVVWRISHQLSLRMIPSCYGHGNGENAHAPPSHEKLRGGLLFWSGATEKDTDTSGDGQHGDKDEIISPSEARHQFLGSSNDRHFKPACSPTTYKLTTQHSISFAAIKDNQTYCKDTLKWLRMRQHSVLHTCIIRISAFKQLVNSIRCSDKIYPSDHLSSLWYRQWHSYSIFWIDQHTINISNYYTSLNRQ